MAKSVDKALSRFHKASLDDLKPRIVANSVGEVGSGKTHWWIAGAPGPIIIQSTDLGLEGVIEPFTKKKDIYIATYDAGQTIDESFSINMVKDARDKFIEDFEAALPNCRTLLWDREDFLFRMFQQAEWGTDDAYGAAPPKDWDKLKDKIRRMIAMVKASDINFGVIQGMRNEWVQTISKSSGKKAATQSGRRIAAGMEDIEALMHMNLFHERQGKDFMVSVGKSRGPGALDVQGETFACTFVELATMVFPDTTEEDWE